jgi:hypothetical protein
MQSQILVARCSSICSLLISSALAARPPPAPPPTPHLQQARVCGLRRHIVEHRVDLLLGGVACDHRRVLQQLAIRLHHFIGVAQPPLDLDDLLQRLEPPE